MTVSRSCTTQYVRNTMATQARPLRLSQRYAHVEEVQGIRTQCNVPLPSVLGGSLRPKRVVHREADAEHQEAHSLQSEGQVTFIQSQEQHNRFLKNARVACKGRRMGTHSQQQTVGRFEARHSRQFVAAGRLHGACWALAARLHWLESVNCRRNRARQQGTARREACLFGA